MPLYLITGTAGTGKTAVCDELKRHGYTAFDIDDDGLARWQHTVTGFVHPKSSVKPAMRTAEFIASHRWVVPRDNLQELRAQSAGRPLFLCGSLDNLPLTRDLFGRVFALYIDDETLTYRLQHRTTNDWGKQPHELAQSLAHHHTIYDRHRQWGDVIVDSSWPVETVAADILAAL